MTRARQAALAVGALRVAYGAALVTAPARTTRSWLGPDGERRPAQVAIRGVGGREIAVHSAALAAVLAGAPVRPWLFVSIAGDAADILATGAASSSVPDGAVKATVLVAGASAAISAAVAAWLDC
jgi:hypothetical protein